MLKMAACMRSHGISNFPDPIVNSQGMAFNPHGIDTHSPRFLAAQQVCQVYRQKVQSYFPPGS